MTTIFDTATPKQIEKFAKFKQELLDWKNQHARDYTAFVWHMITLAFAAAPHLWPFGSVT